MHKVKEKNGFKYSLGPFQGYTHRASVLVIEGSHSHTTNLYTNNPDKKSVIEVLSGSVRASESQLSVHINHWTTKEQDDHDSEMIDECLKSI